MAEPSQRWLSLVCVCVCFIAWVGATSDEGHNCPCFLSSCWNLTCLVLEFPCSLNFLVLVFSFPFLSLSYLLPSCLVLSFLLVVFCLVLSFVFFCLALPCLVLVLALPCLVLPCPVLSYLIFFWFISPCVFFSCLRSVLSCLFLVCLPLMSLVLSSLVSSTPLPIFCIFCSFHYFLLIFFTRPPSVFHRPIWRHTIVFVSC